MEIWDDSEMVFTFKEVAEILKIIDASQCEEVIVELQGLRLVVRRGSPNGAGSKLPELATACRGAACFGIAGIGMGRQELGQHASPRHGGRRACWRARADGGQLLQTRLAPRAAVRRGWPAREDGRPAVLDRGDEALHARSPRQPTA